MTGCIRQRGSLPWLLATSVGGGLLGIAFLLALLWLAVWAGRLRQWRALTPMQRAEARELKRHPFFPASGRARAAYLILCFEEGLRACGQDLALWGWVRRELWSVTELFFEDWLERIGDLLPDAVLEDASFEAMLARREPTIFPGYAYSEAEYKALRGLYRQAGSALPTLAFLLCRIFQAVEFDGDSPGGAHSLDSIRILRQTEAFLESHGIPLPQDTEAVAFLLRQRARDFGRPFPPLYR